MRFKILFAFIFCCGIVLSQTNFGEKLNKTMLATLHEGDSLVYYQCRVKQAKIGINTGSQQIDSKEQQITITEKFVIVRKANNYINRYYASGLTVLPNRKFSGLKMKEKPEWNFTFKSERLLTEREVLYLASLEKRGTGTNEFDFVISKRNPNQIIIWHRKNFEQLNLSDSICISEALKL